MKRGKEGQSFVCWTVPFRLLSSLVFVPSPQAAGLRDAKSSVWLSFNINGGLTCIEIHHEKVDA